MSIREARTFSIDIAKRTALWLLLAIYGPSGSGKTFSAIRLAMGIASVCGGGVFVIDTENRRASHYADLFNFKVIDLQPPFDSDSYIDAIRACVAAGAKVIVIDSGTHEHEHLKQWHRDEVHRLARGDESRYDAYKMMAWIQPQAARDRLILELARVQAHLIWCFRADTKMDLKNPKKPENMGWMPEGARKLIYEMTAAALLLPGANGVPTWNPTGEGEKQMVKSPKQFRELFDRFNGKPFCEEIGAEMARWAQGDTAPQNEPPLHERIAEFIGEQSTHEGLDRAKSWIAKESVTLGKEHGPKLVESLKAKRATLAEGA
jgi:hypothetical protein